MPTAQDPSATPIAAATKPAPTESVRGNAGPFADDAQDTVRASESSNGASGAKASSVLSEPVEISLVAVLGLVVAGFLFRIAMTARRRKLFIVRPESDCLDHRNGHNLRHEQQHAEPVYRRQELFDDFIDRPEPPCMDDRNERELRDRQQWSQWNKKPVQDLQGRLMGAASRPFRNDDESEENPRRGDRDSDVTTEISKREDMLEQLKRDIDRLLRSSKVTERGQRQQPFDILVSRRS
jgi:hypothetical protein